MQTKYLRHRHGGRIIAIHALGQSTFKGVASWYFIGHVKWHDGTESPRCEMAPFTVCHIQADGESGREECEKVMDVMDTYLDKHGKWHDYKDTRDGRRYSWTPNKPKCEQPMDEVMKEAA